MAKHLTDSDVVEIVELLQSWKFKLTWELLVQACEKSLGLTTTRQALNRKAQIKEEFDIRKRALKTGVDDTPKPNSIQQAHARIARLLKRNKELEEQNALYREKFLRWQFNAERYGVGKEQLEKPLMRPDLGSDKNIGRQN